VIKTHDSRSILNSRLWISVKSIISNTEFSILKKGYLETSFSNLGKEATALHNEHQKQTTYIFSTIYQSVIILSYHDLTDKDSKLFLELLRFVRIF